ncbi:hypothetical protein JXQ70_14575 [bacterium]|nr:hypothetical protein [bacterium]
MRLRRMLSKRMIGFSVMVCLFILGGIHLSQPQTWALITPGPKTEWTNDPLPQRVITHEVVFDQAELELGKEMDFIKVSLPGSYYTRDVGKPRLPWYALQFALSPGMTVDRLEIELDEIEQISGQYLLYPAQESVRIGYPAPFTPPDPSSYRSSQPYPVNPVSLVSEGSMRGMGVVTIYVYPVQYLAHSQSLIFHARIRFKLHEKHRLVPFQQPRRALPNKVVPELIDQIVLNPEVVHEYFKSTKDVKEPVHYLLITSNILLDSNVYQPLLDDKMNRGIMVGTKSIQNIIKTYPGRDSTEKIRNCIKDFYLNNGLVWVLLGGDTAIIPSRDAYSTTSDQYFSCIDGDWDGDGDSIFGEFEDNVDLLPDVMVGRAPVENYTEASTFVNKVLTYQANSASYRYKALFLGCNDYNDTGGQNKDLIDDEYMPPEFDPITKYYERNIPAYAALTIQALNQGYHLVNHIDHADVNYLYTGNDSISTSDVDSLSNNAAPSILWSCGCHPAALYHDCIAEHWVTNPQGGGVAFIGNSEYGLYPESDSYLDPEFYKMLFVNMIFNIGQTLALSKVTFNGLAETNGDMRYSMFELNLLGDPEMVIQVGDNAVPSLMPNALIVLLILFSILFSGNSSAGAVTLLKKLKKNQNSTEYRVESTIGLLCSWM